MRRFLPVRLAALLIAFFLGTVPLSASPYLEADSLNLFYINRTQIRDDTGLIPAGEFRLFARGWDGSLRVLYSEMRTAAGKSVDVAFYLDTGMKDIVVEYGPRGEAGRTEIALAGYGLASRAGERDAIGTLTAPAIRLKAPAPRIAFPRGSVSTLIPPENFDKPGGGGFHESLVFDRTGLAEVSGIFAATCRAGPDPLLLAALVFVGFFSGLFGFFLYRHRGSAIVPGIVLFLGLLLATMLPHEGTLFLLPLGDFDPDMSVSGIYRASIPPSGESAVVIYSQDGTAHSGASEHARLSAVGLWGPGERLIPVEALYAPDTSNSGRSTLRLRLSATPELRCIDGRFYLSPKGFISGWILR